MKNLPIVDVAMTLVALGLLIAAMITQNELGYSFGLYVLYALAATINKWFINKKQDYENKNQS